MSLKDRFANRSETKDEQPQPEEQKSVELYDTPGHARNICFVQADGSMTFLNYAYLVSGEYDPERSEIKLSFTTHQVNINGINIHSVFNSLLLHSVQKLYEALQRYESVQVGNGATISKIYIQKLISNV